MAQAQVVHPGAPEPLGVTERKDLWWVGPLATGLGLAAFFLVYAPFRALSNADFQLGMGTDPPVLTEHAYVLSPMYSPLIVLPASLSWISPAFLILWAPGGFRITCYYYRKAYYRAFFLDPVGCGVGEPAAFCGVQRGKEYKGETHLLLFQNLHRYFLYFALIFLVLLAVDVIHTMRWPSGFNMSFATIVLALSTTLLTLYTLSCHSFRHLIGGRLDGFSKKPFGPIRYKLWMWTSLLNEHHMFWAWTSLFGVGFADFYVWMVASGRIADFPFF